MVVQDLSGRLSARRLRVMRKNWLDNNPRCKMARNDQHWEAAAFAFTCAAAGLVIIGIVLFVSWLS